MWRLNGFDFYYCPFFCFCLKQTVLTWNRIHSLILIFGTVHLIFTLISCVIVHKYTKTAKCKLNMHKSNGNSTSIYTNIINKFDFFFKEKMFKKMHTHEIPISFVGPNIHEVSSFNGSGRTNWHPENFLNSSATIELT